MKMMELDSDYVNSSWDGAAINVKCNDQESTVIKLKLEDFKNECGYLNVLSYPEGPGGYGQIAYFPTAKILRNPVVPPKLEPELTLPELQEGSPVNITCVTPPGRPPPVIQMFLDKHQSGNDSVHASNTETNANFEANINIYSNVVASFSRPVAQTAEQNELVYADIDIAFLELKQKKVTKKNKYVPTEYTSVRELTADVSDEHVYVNT
ncbi:hypothetical protein DPMN_089196 [Dreissena polymorpha]|uniref:Uncharacterized protein n=1 Tax=Dreissena polymorpha TaxID=45954 RepID=A0A9D4KWH2_DREPO|nr:hypothetical protein DPMN_089196 [Dreissena polymorpha]